MMRNKNEMGYSTEGMSEEAPRGGIASRAVPHSAAERILGGETTKPARGANETVTYSRKELDKLEGQTDWTRLSEITDGEIDAAVASDPDAFFATRQEWQAAVVIRPKRAVSIRLDTGVIDYFKSQGRGYQTRINQVLRDYVRAVSKTPR